MSGALNAQTVALQHEKVRPNLPLMYQQDSTLWSKIKSRGDIEVVSSRATRVPMELLSGGKFRVGNPDAGDLGLGNGITTDNGTLTPVYFFQAHQYSKLAEIVTDSSEKAIENYAMLTMKRAMNQFNTNMEAAIQGDGSNTLDSVVSTASQQLTVVNANQFSDGLDVDVWSAPGGTFRNTATITSVDAGNKQLNLSTVIGTIVAGDVIQIGNGGTSQAAGTGIFGVKAYQVNSNTGSVMGLSRASYPGKLSTPTVNAGGAALTPAIARRAFAQLQTALGIDAPDEEELVFHMNTDMVAAWENTGLQVSSVIQNQLSGSSSQDMLKKSAPKSFAGRPIVASIHATPGRIDGLCLKHWFRVESQPIDYFEIGGQTLFPAYTTSGASAGGLNASTLFYLWTGVNIGNDNVRAGVFISNLAIPAGY